MSLWNDAELKNLFLSETPLIDVRSPIEFSESSLPHSVNLPIMNNEERAKVGTYYKEYGQSAAIKLGHELVSGKVKDERITNWLKYLGLYPEGQIFCFRGGLRSQITCQWLKEAGIQKNPIEGGYKRMRRFFLSQIEEAPLPQLYRLGGMTGSGKTNTLKNLDHSIDLEKLANHRGSAFGENGIQPCQIRFENELALSLMRIKDVAIVEDESAMIGRLTLPKRFYQHMRQSPLIILHCDHAERIKNIFHDYVVTSSESVIRQALSRIAKNLGGARFKEVDERVQAAFAQEMVVENHTEWISILLKYYYDPFYQKDLKRQSGQIAFEGNAHEVCEFINSRPL